MKLSGPAATALYVFLGDVPPALAAEGEASRAGIPLTVEVEGLPPSCATRDSLGQITGLPLVAEGRAGGGAWRVTIRSVDGVLHATLQRPDGSLAASKEVIPTAGESTCQVGSELAAIMLAAHLPRLNDPESREEEEVREAKIPRSSGQHDYATCC